MLERVLERVLESERKCERVRTDLGMVSNADTNLHEYPRLKLTIKSTQIPKLKD